MKFLVLSMFLTSACCGVQPPPPPPPPQPTLFDASCIEACKHAKVLGCDFGKPSRGGIPCFDGCFVAMSNGIPIPTGCVARAKSCEAIRWCEEMAEQ